MKKFIFLLLLIPAMVAGQTYRPERIINTSSGDILSTYRVETSINEEKKGGGTTPQFNPDYDGNAIVWLEYDDASTLTLSSDTIKKWDSKNTEGYDFSGSIGSNGYPYFTTDAVIATPCPATYNQCNSAYLLSGDGLSTWANYTIYLCVKVGEIPEDGKMASFGIYSSDYAHGLELSPYYNTAYSTTTWMLDLSIDYVSKYSGTISAPTANSVHLITITQSSIRIDGTEITTLSPALGSIYNYIYIIPYCWMVRKPSPPFTTNYAKNSFKCVIIRKTSDTGTTLDNVEDYIMTKYL